MEIVHLILGKANPDRMNGVNRVVHHLATSQTEGGNSVSVWGITPTPERGYPDGRRYRTRLFRSMTNKFRLDRELEHAILTAAPGTVFQVHGGFIPEFHRATRLMKRAGHHYLFTPHGSYNKVALRKRMWLKRIYLKCFERYVIRNARAIHLLGDSEDEMLREWCPDQKRFVVPNGMDPAALEHRAISLPRTQSPVFGFCGRLDAYTKGLDTLIDGFARYAQSGQPGECWIIGDGPDRAALQERVHRLGLDGRVFFFGAMYGDEKLNRMANMDVFLHPSRNEGMPAAVLEASGLGVPCIVSEETNIGDYIRRFNAGVVLEQNTSQSLTESLVRFRNELSRFSIQPLKNNARRMVREEFDWNRVAQHLQPLYSA